MWRIDKVTLLPYILLYMYTPSFIFLIGWVKCVVSIPSCFVLAVIMKQFYFKANNGNRGESIEISYFTICVISLILLVVGLVCGYGGFTEQAGDWVKHNAILQDLYTHPWPVFYNVDDVPVMLTYYHALYLFPALLGKIFHSAVLAELSFGVICLLGLWLMVIFIIVIVRADTWYKQLLITLSFIFFSGMLYPLQKFCHILIGGGFCNNWHAFQLGSHLLQYRSIFVMLRWVGPQCFIAWLAVALFYCYKEDYCVYTTIALPAILSGTWAFLGLILLMLFYLGFRSLDRTGDMRAVLSWRNLIPAIFPGVVFVSYLTGNKIVVRGGGVELVGYHGNDLLLLFLFLFFIYGAVVAIVWLDNRKNSLFYTIPISLVIIPFFSIGSRTDFVMGVSIPAIVLLFIFTARYLLSTNNRFILKLVLSLVLCLGTIYPIAEMKTVKWRHVHLCDRDYSKHTIESCFKANEKSEGIVYENYISETILRYPFYKFFSKK